jgi:1,4-dihydroxy-6-naphthoate synthase
VLADIEELNQRAASGELDLTKLSYGALPAHSDHYALLRSGSALGRGCGPLLVAREPCTLDEAAVGRVLIPGRETTAFLLLRLAAPQLGEVVERRYDEIPGAVVAGEADAGLIIHESRFTYAERGLVLVADLGELWEERSGLPIPLGAICARRDLGSDVIAAADAAVRASVEHAFAHREDSRAYVRAHAQELSDAICDAHIALYVNEFSIDLGDEGMRAVEALSAAAA